jgi:hypothetical protein
MTERRFGMWIIVDGVAGRIDGQIGRGVSDEKYAVRHSSYALCPALTSICGNVILCINSKR